MTQTQAQIMLILIAIYVAASVLIAALAAAKNFPRSFRRRRRERDESHLEEIHDLVVNIHNFISNKYKPFPDAQDYADYEEKIKQLQREIQRLEGIITFHADTNNNLNNVIDRQRENAEVQWKNFLALKTDKDKLESRILHLTDEIKVTQKEKTECENSQARLIQELQSERQANDELRAHIQELNKEE